VNFGVSVLSLKKMAKGIGQNHDLAQLLWAENIRELKILATLVQPAETFSVQLANDWVKNITLPEQAEQACMNLFQHLQGARGLALDWLSQEPEMVRFTAWHLMARVVKLNGDFTGDEFDFILKQAMRDLESHQLNLFNGALLGLKRVGVVNKFFGEEILKNVEKLSLPNGEKQRQIVEDLKFEYEYYL
jgi:hypothetical protein